MEEVFKALSDPTRIKIVRMLAENGEMCVCRIADNLNMGQPVISHHMAKLKQAGLLYSRRESQWIHYSLNIDFLKNDLLTFISEVVNTAEKNAKKAEKGSCC